MWHTIGSLSSSPAQKLRPGTKLLTYLYKEFNIGLHLRGCEVLLLKNKVATSGNWHKSLHWAALYQQKCYYAEGNIKILRNEHVICRKGGKNC